MRQVGSAAILDGIHVAVQGVAVGYTARSLLPWAHGLSAADVDPLAERAALGAVARKIFDINAMSCPLCARLGAERPYDCPHSAPIIAGAANNQLAEPCARRRSERAGHLYAPDYAINAGAPSTWRWCDGL
jgi:leucine dehydrogenase